MLVPEGREDAPFVEDVSAFAAPWDAEAGDV